MDEKNEIEDLKQLQDYEEYIDDSKASNLFTNALKSISTFLQKINIIKPEQKLLGTKNTNSRGFQTTSQSPTAATSKKSLKALLRNSFENMQKNRAERIRAANTKNTIPKQTITQTIKPELNQEVSKESLKDPIIVPVAKSQTVNAPQIPNIINNTVILAESEAQKASPKEEKPSTEEILVDKNFKDAEKESIPTQDDLNNEFGVVTMEVANENTITKPKEKTPHAHEDKSDDELSH